jgi:hypothetical protein
MDKHFSLGGKKNAEGLAAAVASVPLETTLPSSNANGDELRRKRAMILIGG